MLLALGAGDPAVIPKVFVPLNDLCMGGVARWEQGKVQKERDSPGGGRAPSESFPVAHHLWASSSFCSCAVPCAEFPCSHQWWTVAQMPSPSPLKHGGDELAGARGDGSVKGGGSEMQRRTRGWVLEQTRKNISGQTGDL